VAGFAPTDGSPLELVVLVGLQASGKTTFRNERFVATHVVVSKDDFRNNSNPERRQQFLIREALASGRSVVVDNTNVRREHRVALIEQARAHAARVVGYCFQPSVADSLKRNAQRSGRARIPDVGIKATAKVWVPPSLAEGFDALFEVRIVEGGFSVQDYRDPA
jgi:predicted kinase